MSIRISRAWCLLALQLTVPAIDACAAQGGGVAYVPSGRYVSGPLWLKDNVELRLEAGATIVLNQAGRT